MNDKTFISNTSVTTFLDKIISDLDSCQSFEFSVSFIKKAGLVLLEKSLEAALKRGAHGKILTSTYQNFTDIASLEYFLNLAKTYPRFECHLEYNSFGDDGFHTKGYLFHFSNYHEIVIGSSNITYFALKKNVEWDASIVTNPEDAFLKQIEDEFSFLWNKTYVLNSDVIKRYQMRLSYAIEQWDMDYCDPDVMAQIRPNLMQQQALKEIRRYRSMAINKALVIAATGSGKTYLAAFDAFNFQAKKLLFVVHKDMILTEAMQTFKKVFSSKRTYGLYTGESKELEADFIFASNQVLARHLDLFDPTEFDYIVIDEVHHAAASTYQKIIHFFKPQFLLGLTATPDRMDGQSIYDLFEKNVPYDLTLREALENNLVVPFKYYGIHDSLIDYSDNETSEGVRKMIRAISSNVHCRFVAEQIERHKPKNEKLRCIGFCRNVTHAMLMAQGMRELGYTTQYLTSQNTTGERMKVFDDLQDDNNPLSLVFTVDILNEGIDIPSMNMVLFLRPTESSTIFIQQLGRGLRKYKDKQYLTVLDFIANSYRRSAQIAIALGTLTKSGETSKATIQEIVRAEGKDIGIPGVEIHLDKESIEEILHSVENTNFNRFELLKQDYFHFKEYLKLGTGQYPMPTDFLNSEVSADLLRYTKKFESYYDFLLKCGEDVPLFDETQIKVIRTLSWFLPLVRIEDYQIIKVLLNGPQTHANLEAICKDNDNFNPASFEHALRLLEGEIVCTWGQNHKDLIMEKNDLVSLTFDASNPIFKNWILNLIDYGIERYNSEFHDDNNLLKRYGKYTGPKAFMALNHNNMFYMTGVHYIENHLCLFINLHKDLESENPLNYEDKFISNKVLQWESQTGTTLDNLKGKKLIQTKFADIFVRKTKKEDGVEVPFSYLGMGVLTNPRPSHNPSKTLLFDIILNKEIPEEYDYDFAIPTAK